MRIPISEIKVSPGRREVDPEDVQELADSIRDVGLLHPIIVDKKYTLIAGLHRLEAAKLLEWIEIECTVSSLEGLKVELAEIDEHVIRSDLPTMEFGELLLKRKEIYEALHPGAKNGGDRKSQNITNAKCNSDPVKSFVQDTANKLGVSTSTVHRQLQAAKNITQGAKDIVRDGGVQIAKKTAMKLSRLEPNQQKEAASQLAAGAIKSVEEYMNMTANKANDVAAPSNAAVDKEPVEPKTVPPTVEPVFAPPSETSHDEPKPAAVPYRLPDRQFSTFEESIADLKDPDKDCSCTPDIFLAEYCGFIRKFVKDIQWYSTPQYEAVFPALTQIQIEYLRSQTETLCSAAEELLKQVERKNSA